MGSSPTAIAGVPPMHSHAHARVGQVRRPGAGAGYDADSVATWVGKVTGTTVSSADLHGALRSGEVLCKLINRLQPGSVRGCMHVRAWVCVLGFGCVPVPGPVGAFHCFCVFLFISVMSVYKIRLRTLTHECISTAMGAVRQVLFLLL